MFKFLLLLLINFTLLNCGDISKKESANKADITKNIPNNANIAKKATKQAINTEVNNTVINLAKEPEQQNINKLKPFVLRKKPLKKETKYALKKKPIIKKPVVTGICDRTAIVKYLILYKMNNKDCLEITKKDLLTIVELDLKDRSIASLKTADFLGLDNLEDLDLSHNRLSTLPVDFFKKNFPKLENLNLTENLFDEVFKESLTNSLQSQKGMIWTYWYLEL